MGFWGVGGRRKKGLVILMLINGNLTCVQNFCQPELLGFRPNVHDKPFLEKNHGESVGRPGTVGHL